MKTPLYITGNPKKAEYLKKYLGVTLEHKALEVEEIQSLDLKTVVRHKMRVAYAVVGQPVLVEDTSLEFCALGRLPGTFIKHFLEEIGPEGLVQLLDGKERRAIARTMFGYFDGTEEMFLAGMMHGAIAEMPRGEGGFGEKGWDSIFIPEGYSVTRAELSAEDHEITYLKIKPLRELKEFLETV